MGICIYNMSSDKTNDGLDNKIANSARSSAGVLGVSSTDKTSSSSFSFFYLNANYFYFLSNIFIF